MKCDDIPIIQSPVNPVSESPGILDLRGYQLWRSSYAPHPCGWVKIDLAFQLSFSSPDSGQLYTTGYSTMGKR